MMIYSRTAVAAAGKAVESGEPSAGDRQRSLVSFPVNATVLK
jgi:hypothetical protein